LFLTHAHATICLPQELSEATGAAEVEVVAPDPSMMRPDKRAFFLEEGGGGANYAQASSTSFAYRSV
jgi:hypothetical protein